MIVLPFAIRVDWDIQTIEVERRESQLAGIEGTGGIQLNPWNGYAPEGKTLALAPFLAVAFKARVGVPGTKRGEDRGCSSRSKVAGPLPVFSRISCPEGSKRMGFPDPLSAVRVPVRASAPLDSNCRKPWPRWLRSHQEEGQLIQGRPGRH